MVMARRYLEMMVEYGCSVTRSNRPIMPAEQARAMGLLAHLFIAGRPKGENWADAHRQKIAGIVKRYEDAGYRQEELWYESFDEPGDKTAEKWVRLAKVAAEAFPDVKIWLNPGWQRWQSDAGFKRFNRWAEVWWPYAGNLVVPGRLEFLRSTGKPIGFYIERGWHGMNSDAPWAYFHRMPMITAAYGIDGCSFWSSSSYWGDAWNDLDARHAESATFWPGRDGPISTIGWEAWREGIYDLYTIRWLSGQARLDPRAFGKAMLRAQSAQDVESLRQRLWETTVQP